MPIIVTMNPGPGTRVDAAAISELAQRCAGESFCGAVRVEAEHGLIHASAHGFADRAHEIGNDLDTRFATASATKGCTALVVMRLIELGTLSLSTTMRSVLGPDLAHLDDEITVHHLLSHRSGIGEFCPELHERSDGAGVRQCAIESPRAIVALLADVPMRSELNTEFRYNNAGYVLLALIAERTTGVPIDALIERFVLAPAQMTRTGMLAYDALPGDAAIGYLDRHGLTTNVHHVPNRGVGDGGLFTTVADTTRFWLALERGAIVGERSLALMTTPHGATARGTPYGYGFWLHPRSDALQLEGYDAGISFRSVHQPSTRITWTVASNWTDGAWELADQLDHLIPTSASNPPDPTIRRTGPNS